MVNELWWEVSVPVGLLIDSNLSPESRALFMLALDLCEKTSGTFSWEQLLDRSGVADRRTINKYFRELEDAAWIRIPEEPGGSLPRIDFRPMRVHAAARPVIKLPGTLIQLADVSLYARWLYAAIRAVTERSTGVPAKSRPSAGVPAKSRPGAGVPAKSRPGTVAMRQPEWLALAGRRSRKSLSSAIAQLTNANWLAVSKRHGTAGGSVYRPLDPHLAARRQLAEEVSIRLDQVQYRGEPMLKELLDAIVIDRHYIDNARPESLANPLTGEPLEIDRLYASANVGIEYNGTQHFRTTPAFPDPDKLRKQQAHDLIKKALADDNEITLIEIRAVDLLPSTVARKLAPYLPMRELRYEDPVLGYLHRECRKHVAKAKRGKFVDETTELTD